MEPVERKNEGSKRFGIGNLKKAAIITSIVFTVCVILALLFSTYTNNIIGRLLKEVVYFRSDGTYELRYDDIEYNFANKTLYVKNLRFIVDSAAVDLPQHLSQKKDNIYNAYVPEMLIDIADIWKVYFNRELDIDGIQAFKPNLNITSYKEEEYKKWQSDAGALYKVISGYLEIFRIDNFKIENGKFLFEKLGARNRKYEVEDVSFSIKNFLLTRDPRFDKEKFFYTDDIDISLKNQQLLLKDSIHKLAFKKLMLSTTESKILVDSLVISERDDLKGSKQKERHNAYNMYVPRILLDSVNFKEAYNNGLLHIGKLLVHLPEIHIDKQRKKLRDERDTLNSNFSNLVAEYFENVRIDTFFIKNAAVTFSNLRQQKREQFTLDSTNIILTNLVLDTTIFTRENRKIVYDHIDVEVNDYEFLLPDSIHKVSFSKLAGSSASQLLVVNDVKLEPRDINNIESLLRKNKRKNVFYGRAPKISFKGVYGREFINEDSLKVNALTLHSPNFEIITYQHLPSKEDTLSFNNLLDPFPFIEQYFDALYLDQFEIADGNIDVKEQGEKSIPISQMQGINLKLKGIEIDSSTNKGQLLSSQHQDLSIRSLLQNFHKSSNILKIDSFDYSSESGKLSTGNIAFHPAENDTDAPNRNEISLIGKGLFASDLNLENLFNKSGVFLDSLSILHPEVIYNRSSTHHKDTVPSQKLLKEYYDLHLANSINIENGSFIYFNAAGQRIGEFKFYGQLKNIHWDSLRHNKFPVVDGYQLQLNNGKLITEDLNLEADSALISNLSQDSYFRNLHIQPQNSNQSSLTDIKIPELNFSNLDLLKYYEQNMLQFDGCKISEPSLFISLDKDTLSTNDMEPQSIESQILKFAHTIDGKHIQVSNGNLQVSSKIRSPKFHAILPGFDLSLNDLHIDSTNRSDLAEELLKNINFNGYQLQLKADDMLDTLLVENVHIPNASKHIELNEVYFARNSQLQPPHYSGNIDSLIITYCDRHKLVKDKTIHLEAISLVTPDVVIESKEKREQVSLKDLLLLRNISLDNKLFNSININEIKCKQGHLALHMEKDQKPWQFSVKDLNFFSENFVLDSNQQSRNKLLASDNFTFSFKDFKYFLPDSLNRIDIGEISYSTYDSTLVLHDLTNTPLVEKYDYGPAAGIQSDWLDMKFERIQFNSLYPMVSLDKNGVIADKLIINGMDIYAFRDKRIPREENLHKPLPQERLLNLDYLVNIDSVKLNNSTVTYEEVTKTAPYSGSVTFTSLEADLYNLCNQKTELQQNPHCIIDASGKLMDDGLIEAKFTFDLNDPENTFLIDAYLHEMHLPEFNTLLEPIVRIKVKSGSGKSLKMYAEANNELAIGNMDFYYDNLKVSVLNKNNYTTRGMGSTINSFFANTFIINKKNPRLIFTTEGNIYYERDTTRSIFNYWSKIFFSGIVSSIGAKSNKKEIRQYEKSEGNDKLTTKD